MSQMGVGVDSWIRPHSTSLLPGTIADLAKGKSELLVENALLRKPLIIVHRQIKRPACKKTDRFLLVRAARGGWDLEAGVLHSAAGDRASVASRTLSLLLEAPVKG